MLNLQFSRTMAYAVSASVYLAHAASREPLSCTTLADACGMPNRFLLQILRSLVRKGVLVSIRGARGGYKLARDPEQISLLEIIEAVDCPFANGEMTDPTQGNLGGLHQKMQELNSFLRNSLESTSLAWLTSVSSPVMAEPAPFGISVDLTTAPMGVTDLGTVTTSPDMMPASLLPLSVMSAAPPLPAACSMRLDGSAGNSKEKPLYRQPTLPRVANLQPGTDPSGHEMGHAGMFVV